MKTFLKIFIAVLALALMSSPGQMLRAADANADVSFQTFYDQLSGQGNWIQTNDYGYVFQPNVNDANWRPYTYGHWVDTDDGMMWVSDEPFGWATYHYGRWVNLDDYGWVWVPGYTWAPAWVSWRDGDDDVGWAPLPPETAVGIDYFDPGFDIGFGFHIGDDCDVAYGIGPGWYNFCPVAYIGDRDCWRHFRDHRDNFAYIGRTRNITNLNVYNHHRGGRFDRFDRVRAGGPSLARLNAQAHHPIQRADLNATSRLADNGRMHGNSLSVFAPNVNRDSVRNARPHNVSQTLANARVNRGTNINNPLAVNSRVRSAGPTSDQIRAASLAQGQGAGRAKIANDNTHPSRALNRSLTSFQTNPGTNRNNSGRGTNFQQGRHDNADRTFTGQASAQQSRHNNADRAFTGEANKATPGSGFREAQSSPPAGSFRSPAVAAPSQAVNHQATERHQASVSNAGNDARAFTGWGGQPAQHVTRQANAPVFHQQAPMVHASPPAVSHPQASIQRQGNFHPQSSFRPQPSFHPAASVQHFNGGGQPSHNFGGGGGGQHFNGGGGGRSGGGGQAHAGGGGGNGGGHGGHH